MKYLFIERSEKNHPNEPMLSATQNEGVILQSKYKNRVVVVNKGFEGLKLVKVGDLLYICVLFKVEQNIPMTKEL